MKVTTLNGAINYSVILNRGEEVCLAVRKAIGDNYIKMFQHFPALRQKIQFAIATALLLRSLLSTKNRQKKGANTVGSIPIVDYKRFFSENFRNVFAPYPLKFLRFPFWRSLPRRSKAAILL